MKIKAKILRNQVHHFIENGNDVLQIDVQFPDYPLLPTYGLRVDFPITKQKVKDAVRAKAVEAMAQITRDTVVRNLLDGDFEFDVEV